MKHPTTESDSHLILIVDDDPASLDVKSRWLNHEGYRVIEATNGTEALALATVERPALILLDLNLPDSNGFEVCERLKASLEAKHIKVLQISAGRMNARDRVRGLKAGADAYLVEPVEEEELIATVRALLKLAQQESENEQLIRTLSHTQRQLLDATQAAHCGMWDWDIPTGKLEWFGAHEHLAEMLPGGFSGKIQAFIDVLHPDDRARVWQKLQALMARCETQYVDEYRFIHPDGSARWMHGTGRLYYDDHGHAVRMTGVVQDITERKKAEETSHTSEARLCRILLQSPAGIVQTDAQGNMVLVNQRWCDMLGYSEAELLRMSVADVTHPSSLEATLAAVGRLAQGGPDFQIDKNYRRKDGSVLRANSNVTALRDEDGHFQGLLAIVRDLTERLNTEERLRESEHRYRALVDATSAVTWTCPPSGLHVEPQLSWMAFTGQTAEEMLGAGWTKVVHPADLEGAAQRWSNAVAKGEPFTNEHRIRRHDGEWRWMSVYAAPIHDANGQVLEWSGMNIDITERKQAEAALAEQKRLYQSVTDNASVALFIMDERQHCVFMNPAAEQLTGYRLVETQGRPLHDVVHHTRPDGRPYPLSECPIDQAFPQKNQMQGEEVFIHKDGHFYYVAFTASPLRDETGKPVGTVIEVQDITERKKAEEQLRENEERLRVLTTAMPQLVWACSNIGECIYQSPQWQSVTGQSATDSLKFGWTEMIHPDDRACVAEEWRTTVAQGTTYQTEYRLHIKDGTYRWYLARAEPLHDESGALVQWIGTSTDIDEAKRMEAALRQSKERLRLATQAAAVGIWEWNVKTNHIRWDAQMFTIYQTAPTADGLVPYSTWSHAVVPDDLPEQERVLWETVRAHGSSSRQFRIHRYGDGDVRHIEAVETVRIDEQGETEWVVGTNIDVTERKQAEQALRESQERLEGLVDSAMDAVIAIDEQLGIALFNPAAERMFGCSAGEVLGSSIDRFIPEASRVAHRQHVDEFGRTGDTARRMGALGAVSGLRANGEEFPIEASISSMITRGQRLFTVILRDITDRQRAERALRGAQERLQRWNVELEQTVNSKTVELQQSQSRLRAMASELNLAEQRERKRLATELHDHLQQLLVLGKMEIGRGRRFTSGVPECEAVLKRVDDVVSEALTYSRTLVAELSPPVLHEHGLAASLRWLGEYITKHNQTVTVIVPEGQGPKLPEDERVLLFQSVRELLINSAKHAGTGQATLSMEERDGTLFITVRDEGQGFDPAAAAGELTSSGISSKYGLYSIQERMRAIGGSCTIDSAPGQGTTALLVSPLTRPAKDREVTPAFSGAKDGHEALSADHSGGHTPGISIVKLLLVDDHAMMREGLRSVLDAYEDIQVVGEARDGLEAVQLVGKLRPQVVLMDINMPKMSGIEATTKIMEQYPETIIIGLSVNATDDNREAMTTAGASRLLSKEAAVGQLHHAVYAAVTERAKGKATPGP